MKQKINLRLALIAIIAVLSSAIVTTLVCYNLFQTQVQRDLETYTSLLADTGVFQDAYAKTDDINSYAESTALEDLRRENPQPLPQQR